MTLVNQISTGNINFINSGTINVGISSDSTNLANIILSVNAAAIGSGNGSFDGNVAGDLNVSGNLVVTGADISISNTMLVGPVVNMSWTVTNISSGLATVVDQFPITEMSTARLTVIITAPGHGSHSMEFFMVQDGTHIFLQQYSEIFTNVSLGSLDAVLSGGNVQVILTPVFQNNAVKVARYGITP